MKKSFTTHTDQTAQSGSWQVPRRTESRDILRTVLLDHFRCPESLACNTGTEQPISGDTELPSELAALIDNLRLEGYALDRARFSAKLTTHRAMRSIYYLMRPFLSVAGRRHLQRIALRDWHKRSFPRWPVDMTVEHLLKEILLHQMKSQGLTVVPFIWFWPEGHTSCAIMTHDVEAEAGRRFCSALMDIDDSFDIKASFQVVPVKRYTVTRDYMDSIRQRGFEVNVHDWNHDGHLFRERQEFFRRAKLINEFAREHDALGFRAGMLYRNAEWFDALSVSYDMSIPNVAHLDPQRGGCCTVFPYFIGKLLEIPVTTTQDYSLFHILNRYSTDLWERQCDLIMGAHGLMSFIVHPDYLVDELSIKAYKSLLALIAKFRSERGTWVPLAREVNTWWRQRSQMSIVSSGGKLHIEGSGSERACLAFARIENGRITYSRVARDGEEVRPGSSENTNSRNY